MPNKFLSPSGDLEEVFITDYQYIDRFFNTGQLWTWGNASVGQLGDNTIISKSSPVQTVAGGTNWKQVSAGGFHSAAIKSDNTLWLWGSNNSGRLGDNTVINKSSPVQTVAGGTDWQQVSAGSNHTAAIKTDGTLWLWGDNFSGSLGDNTTVNKSSPVQTVTGGTNWKQVSCHYSITAAIKTDGTLWIWGINTYGQLGDNSVVDKSSPVQTISGGTDWQQVDCGYSHVAAIKTDGTLWSWGTNDYGELGDNTIASKSSPVQTVTGGTNWKQVSCGYIFTAAIKTDGTLWLWGVNDYGQLATNDNVYQSSPVQTVSGGTNWKQISSGGYHASAIKTDGTMWAWGYNYDGQLGIDSITDISSPVQTVAGGTNWRQVSAGKDSHTAAITF